MTSSTASASAARAGGTPETAVSWLASPPPREGIQNTHKKKSTLLYLFLTGRRLGGGPKSDVVRSRLPLFVRAPPPLVCFIIGLGLFLQRRDLDQPLFRVQGLVFAVHRTLVRCSFWVFPGRADGLSLRPFFDHSIGALDLQWGIANGYLVDIHAYAVRTATDIAALPTRMQASKLLVLVLLVLSRMLCWFPLSSNQVLT